MSSAQKASIELRILILRFFYSIIAATLDAYCLNDEMCSQNDAYSHCKWIVNRVYGKCKCLDDHRYSSTDKRCYPGRFQNVEN